MRFLPARLSENADARATHVGNRPDVHKEGRMYELTHRRMNATVAGAAAALLLVDLLLDWQKAAVQVGGVVNVQATASGLHGWGIVPAILAVILIALVASPTAPSFWRAITATAMLGTTAAAALGSHAHVSVGMAVAVDNAILWPAWIGLGLAAVAFVATIVPYVAETPRFPRGLVPHGHV